MSGTTALAPEEHAKVEALSKKVYLKPYQSQRTKETKDYLERTLANPGRLESLGIAVDYENMRTNLVKHKQLLDEGTPKELPAAEKNRLFRLAKKLEARISYDMPTHEQMERPTATNVDAHMAWEKRHKKEILAWRSIRRILDPANDSPNFGNIDVLRSNTPPKGDPRRFRYGYDDIRWEESIEEELAESIDDESYVRFLEMRVKDWTQATICRELSWSRKHYEAAMERLRDGMAMAAVAEEEPLSDVDEQPFPDVLDAAATAEEQRQEVSQDPQSWLQQELDRRGLSYYKVEQLCGIPRATIRQACRGDAELNAERAERVRQALSDWDKQAVQKGDE